MARIRSGLPNDPKWEVEFGYPLMDDRVLGPADLEEIRASIEDLDRVDAVKPAVRSIVSRYWPELVAKFPT